FLSPPQQAINIKWSYDGPENPWTAPQVELVQPELNPQTNNTSTWGPPLGKPQTCPPTQPAGCQTRYPPGSSTLWNLYRITWSRSNKGYKPVPGVIGGGERFHVGATFTGVDFNQPDPILIWGVTLYDAQGNPLALHPRLPVYDTGSGNGSGFSLNMYTPP